MRLFVALDIPEPVREEVRRRLDAVRAELPPARWVDPAAIHLTLVFLGAVDEGSVPGLAAGLARAAAGRRPFTMGLAGGGTFPPRRPARVAWIGVEAGPELPALQADVALAAEAALSSAAEAALSSAAEAALGSTAEAALPGWRREERPYHPHVTLARCPEPWRRADADAFAAAFAGPTGEPFPVADAVLFESRLGRGGARYQVVERFPLGAPGGEAV